MHILGRKPWAYYNDFEPGAVAWLKELIKQGLIADGEVDGRSILEVEVSDLTGFRQCHFFAGIGGWSYALRLVGWPDEQPAWTGSPPCQPFSTAGMQKGKEDERHLAPHFAELVAEGRPPILFGEQVASAAVFGKVTSASKRNAGKEPEWAWIDDLSHRLEDARYAIAASDIPAAGIGAPHIRQRTFFGAVDLERMADLRGDGCRETGGGQSATGSDGAFGDRPIGGLADDPSGGWRKECADDQWRAVGDRTERNAAGSGASGGDLRPSPTQGFWGDAGAGMGGMADPRCVGLRGRQSRGVAGPEEKAQGESGEWERLWPHLEYVGARDATSPTQGFWGDADWLFCRDGKWRPVESSLQRLVDGIPAELVRSGTYVPATFPLAPKNKDSRRLQRLKGYGNAIVPQAAAIFIQSFIESLSPPQPIGDDLDDLFG